MTKALNKLSGKVVVITGASSGIGKALTYEFSKYNTKLVIGARNIDELKAIASELSSVGVEVLPVKTDVTSESDCKNLVEQAISRYGQIDILINNAGVSMRALFKDVDLKVIRHLMDVNFWGTVYCTKYALPYLLETKGSVVGVSSIAGFHGLPGRCGYSASKFAMHGFLETLRIENLKNGLHVMIAAPGFTATNVRFSALTADGTPQGMSPRDEKNMMTPEEVAKIIVNGIAKRRRNIIMGTEGKISVLAQRILPTVIDRLLYGYMAKEPNSPFK
ncbi:MAG: SDR family oxidoreductase [Tenuifilum sp.]|uniref:SDR family oxidoreductase n=1 Tax=Tenuifilum sp. TaxID=2760880 RepID=UPI001B3F12D5|nr:SDR family oxidoreductase [Bacteroidales bacterium]HOK61993.1 SDR family oxidoreductase [Tenuifilum sp.]MBP9029249.1 SDR family oxidoreductase [Bacteroidales bacterium]HOK85762.1 SDR family oxidoreductase [Tenuifilum sp.]HON69569.1 SDR family oxidoreductase [Tenuifilum sp.]